MSCKHEWKTYHGLSVFEPFDYCDICGVKRSEVVDQVAQSGSIYDSDFTELAYLDNPFTSLQKDTDTIENNRWAPYKNIYAKLMEDFMHYYTVTKKGHYPSFLVMNYVDYVELTKSFLHYESYDATKFKGAIIQLTNMISAGNPQFQ